jgi:hypothetical protein
MTTGNLAETNGKDFYHSPESVTKQVKLWKETG